MAQKERTAKKRILVIGRDASSGGIIQTVAKNWPTVEAFMCASIAEARTHLSDSTIHLIFCQNCLQDGGYIDLLKVIRTLPRDIPVILVVPDADKEFATDDALRQGVLDIVASPCRRTDIQWMIIRAIQYLRTQEESYRANTHLAG